MVSEPEPDSLCKALLVVVMGVSGSGKTTVGTALAERLGVAYADGDAFHSADNIAKMAAGIPLSDADRQPWLASIGRWLESQRGQGAVVSSSALRRAYRDVLSQAAPSLLFLHLTGTPELLAQRIGRREGHFMPPRLLASQMATLEPLGPDERGIVVDVGPPPAQVVETFLQAVESLA